MKSIEADKFKEQCLALLDSLDDHGLIVTKRGRPVDRVLPCKQTDADLIGSLRHKVTIRGDIVASSTQWGADSRS